MKCPNCDLEMELPKEARIKQIFKGETFYVNTPAFVCNTCALQIMNDEQADALRRAVADAY
jgi:YgiT-type zinc finger domain-containing protein